MRILQVNTHKRSGAIPQIANSIAQSSNYDHLFYSPYGEKDLDKRINNIFRYGYALKSRAFDCDGFLSTVFNKEIERTIRENKSDVVHIHNPHGYYMNYMNLIDLCEKLNIPLVWTLHDYWAISGRCASPAAFSCEGYKDGCKDCKFPQNYPKAWISRSKWNFLKKREKFLSHNIFPVCVTEYQRSKVENAGVFNNRCVVIENGIQHGENITINKQSFADKSKVKLGFLANSWTNAKGLDDLQEIIASASEFNFDCELVIGGLSGSASASSTVVNILNLGKLHSLSDIHNFYCSVDVFVNLSKIDTFGMVNIEALSRKVPVIARPIEPYLSLFSKLDIIQYSDSIQSLRTLIDKARRLVRWCIDNENLARKQFQQIKRLYSVDRMTSKYDELYLYSKQITVRRA